MHPEWGLFPRAVYAIWKALAARGNHFVLSITAVEFYLMTGNDLLANNAPVCCSGTDSEVLGLTRRFLTCPGDVIEILQEIREARRTRSTSMNSAAEEGTATHQGSSRGHAAIMLQILRQEGKAMSTTHSIDYLCTTLHMIDLAGAERPDKNALKRVSGYEAMMEVYRDPTNVSTDVQAAFIYMELSMLGNEFLAATQAYKEGYSYRTVASLNTDGMRYVGRCLSSKAVVVMVVCLSRAPQCGWETWFSCEFGQKMARLETRKVAARKKSLSKSIHEARKAMQENEEKLVRPGGVKSVRIRLQREALIRHQENKLVALRVLAEFCQLPIEDRIRKD